jgi:ATP-dependent DNA helicase RecQ
LAGAAPGRRGGTALVVGAHADPQVLQALKAWRTTAARAAGVPAYVIFHDTTLAAVAEARPRNRDALLALPGLGPTKADRYGDALLEVVARHAASA